MCYNEFSRCVRCGLILDQAERTCEFTDTVTLIQGAKFNRCLTDGTIGVYCIIGGKEILRPDFPVFYEIDSSVDTGSGPAVTSYSPHRQNRIVTVVCQRCTDDAIAHPLIQDHEQAEFGISSSKVSELFPIHELKAKSKQQMEQSNFVGYQGQAKKLDILMSRTLHMFDINRSAPYRQVTPRLEPPVMAGEPPAREEWTTQSYGHRNEMDNSSEIRRWKPRQQLPTRAPFVAAAPPYSLWMVEHYRPYKAWQLNRGSHEGDAIYFRSDPAVRAKVEGQLRWKCLKEVPESRIDKKRPEIDVEECLTAADFKFHHAGQADNNPLAGPARRHPLPPPVPAPSTRPRPSRRARGGRPTSTHSSSSPSRISPSGAIQRPTHPPTPPYTHPSTIINELFDNAIRHRHTIETYTAQLARPPTPPKAVDSASFSTFFDVAGVGDWMMPAPPLAPAPAPAPSPGSAAQHLPTALDMSETAAMDTVMVGPSDAQAPQPEIDPALLLPAAAEATATAAAAAPHAAPPTPAPNAPRSPAWSASAMQPQDTIPLGSRSPHPPILSHPLAYQDFDMVAMDDFIDWDFGVDNTVA